VQGWNVVHLMENGGWIAMAAFVAIALVFYWPRISAWIENRWFRH
jgi:hypothetical protein